VDPFKPNVMIGQVEDLGHLIRTEFEEIDRRLRDALPDESLKKIRQVYATGDGDSWHAAMAIKLAFQIISGVNYESISAMRYLTYGADAMPLTSPEANLVVGISASGSSTRVVQSLEKAKSVNEQLLTIGMVGNPESKVADVADVVFSVQIPDFGPSPGIRTYVASLMGGYALALRLGEVRGKISPNAAQDQREMIKAIADIVEMTIEKVKNRAWEVAEAMRAKPFFSFVGSGPSFATAYFSSAKVVEAAGIFSTAQDLEEWVHIEHHAYPTDYPIYMVAPRGKSFERAEKLAYLVTLLGHPLIAVVEDGESEITKHAQFILPVAGHVPDVYSPLVYHIPADYFACYLAQALGRMPFMQDNNEIRKRINAVSSQIRGSDD
jgi:glutamine---fructose-6-phosphate transaminase (isomerizing)